MIKEGYKLGMLGLTMEEIADFWGISRMTLHRWAKRKPEFCYTIKKGKDEADAKVGDSLYQRANGYTYKELKVFCDKGKIVTFEVLKHYPPDPTSMIFWLKNRQPDKWKDRHEIEGGVTHLHFISVLIQKAHNIDEYKRTGFANGARLN